MSHSLYAVMTFQGLIHLEKELADLGGICAASLMRKDMVLPIGESFHKMDDNCWKKTKFNLINDPR